MQKISEHLILAQGENSASALKNTLHFFESTTLVQYDELRVIDEFILDQSSEHFYKYIAQGVKKNKEVVNKLLLELRQIGIIELTDLTCLEQGYPSKTLHILSHFLDGFIGVDSFFYNLVEDSHWVSDNLLNQLKNVPGNYWLLKLQGFSLSPEESALLHI